MKIFLTYWVLASFFLLPTVNSFSQDVDLAPDFQAVILPLLSDRCFSCHGPDEDANESGLRLDLRAEAIAESDNSGGFAIVPGAPDQSLMIQRVTTTDASLVMPPPSAHRTPLTINEIDALRQWIAAGAEYEKHWSFEPIPQQVPLPEIEHKNWPRQSLDYFVLSELERMQRSPASESEKWRWLRRVSFDLSGLPPTPQEYLEFEQDNGEDAYEKVVDRLLAADSFGQHFAVAWLDVARYADSYGYQSDLLCQVWPYRDWVVRAFNQNKSYDAFIIEQLAGDLLPAANQNQRIATAFNRLHRQTNEGGSIDEEWRIEYAADRVHTFGTAFLGLTLECARCHDHKFDPISTREYYQLMAFYNSIDDAGTYNDSVHIPTPTMLLPSESQAEQLAAIEQEIAGLLRQKQVRQDVIADSVDIEKTPSERPASIKPVAGFNFDQRDEQHRFANATPDGAAATTVAANHTVEGFSGSALRFTGDDPLSITAFPLQVWQPFTVAFRLYLPDGLDQALLFHQSTGTDTGFSGTQLELHQGRLRLSLNRFWPGNAIAIESVIELPRNDWLFVAVSYDGSGTADGLAIEVNGDGKSNVIKDQLCKSPATTQQLIFGERFRTPGASGAAIDELSVFDQRLTSLELELIRDAKEIEDVWDAMDQPTRQEFYRYRLDEQWGELERTHRELVERKFTLLNQIRELMVMEELEQPRETFILQRGEYDAPRSPELRVDRDTPQVLSSFGNQFDRNRLGLAQWLVSAEHPLTARVAVNRFWQNFFGLGLVETSDDFGLQGSRPSHPQLLDWLAHDFVEHGWDVKRLCRQIALSATYRQTSAATPELREADPKNRWLARGPSHRLSAEATRDLALFSSGLLDARLDGPPVSPYQPPGLWRENNSMSPGYQQSSGSDLFRRSLYSVWKRTAPLPNMLALDAAGREICSARRSITSTPIQALVLLNDPQFVEAARFIATRTLVEPHTNSTDRINAMFVRVAGRKAKLSEQVVLEQLYLEQLSSFAVGEAARREFLVVGTLNNDTPTEDKSDVNSIQDHELAAWTVVALAILNSDAAMMLR